MNISILVNLFDKNQLFFDNQSSGDGINYIPFNDLSNEIIQELYLGHLNNSNDLNYLVTLNNTDINYETLYDNLYDKLVWMNNLFYPSQIIIDTTINDLKTQIDTQQKQIAQLTQIVSLYNTKFNGINETLITLLK